MGPTVYGWSARGGKPAARTRVIRMRLAHNRWLQTLSVLLATAPTMLVAGSKAAASGRAHVPANRQDHDARKHDEHDDDAGEDVLGEIHEFFSNATLLLVILHVLGVFASGLAHRESLPLAMFMGRKRADH